MKIEIEEKVVDVLTRLQAQAAARQMPFDAYLAQFVESKPLTGNGNMSLEEVDKVLDELAAPLPFIDWKTDFDAWMSDVEKRAGRYPRGFAMDDSRASIYEGCGE